MNRAVPWAMMFALSGCTDVGAGMYTRGKVVRREDVGEERRVVRRQ